MHMLICSAKEVRGFSFELVEAYSPSDYTWSYQHLTRGCREHGSAIYKHYPRIPEALM